MYTDSVKHRVNIFFRVMIACVGGYLCSMYFSLVVANVFLIIMPRAEAVFLSAFLAIIFFIIFFMTSFAMYSFKKVVIFSVFTTVLFYVLSYTLG